MSLTSEGDGGGCLAIRLETLSSICIRISLWVSPSEPPEVSMYQIMTIKYTFVKVRAQDLRILAQFNIEAEHRSADVNPEMCRVIRSRAVWVKNEARKGVVL